MYESGKKSDIVTTPEIDELLSMNAPVAIGVSGGKDSHACAFRVVDYLDALGHSGPRLLIHSDLGRIEWRDSLPVCEKIAQKLNLELVVVRRKAGDMIQRWETRWKNNLQRYLDLSCVKLILPWSTPSMKYCTSELKVDLICRYLKSRFPGQSIVSASGIRADESSARSKAAIADVQPKLSRKDVVGWNWRPILHWPVQDVFSYLGSQNEPLHEAYTKYGCSRVSCSFCIMSSIHDLKAASTCPDNHDAYRLVASLEIKSAFSFHSNLWLSDIAPQLLSSEQRSVVADAKDRARRRTEAETIIPKHMLFTAGWPESIPTLEEARLLGKVRQIVCESIPVRPTFTDPEEIIARYQELLTAKHQKKVKRVKRMRLICKQDLAVAA